MKSIKFTKITPTQIVLSLVIGLAVVWLLVRSRPSEEEVRNVILISIDTCRADHLSCYGYPSRTTPNIDQLAQESILFTNVYSPVPLTLPAHTSMLTGTIPPYHGVHDNDIYRLDQSCVTLPEILRQNDFTTGAIISAFVLDSQFGLNQGFDHYNDHFEKASKTVNVNERRGEETNHFAFEWLYRHKSERFFLFLHYFDPHFIYEPPEPFASDFADNLYAGEIAYTDYCIGQVIRKLEEMGLYDSTLIIITSDHGEMLGEHGEKTHGYFIYQSALKIPLIFRFPGHSKAKKIDEPVGLIDIVPTICAVLGIDTPSHVQGKDLSSYFSGNQPTNQDRHLYCECLYPTKYDANSLLGVVTDSWKYIQTTRSELYDLTEDPGETNNLIRQHSNRARILQDWLRQVLKKSVRVNDSHDKGRLNDESIKRLESLGYIAGTSVKEVFEFSQNREDPKDLISFGNAYARLLYLVNTKKYDQAKILCKKLISQRPHCYLAHRTMGGIAMAQNDFTTAVVHFNEALKIKPGKPISYTKLDITLTDQDKTHYNLGVVYGKIGRLDEAINEYKKTIAINSNFQKAHFNLGMAYRQKGMLDDAINEFKQALTINPDYVVAHYNIGVVYGKIGRLDEAINKYKQALIINPNYAEAHNNLGSIYDKKGMLDEAFSEYKKAVAINPDLPPAHYNLGRCYSIKNLNSLAADYYYKAGLLFLNQGNKEWALKSYAGLKLTNSKELEQKLYEKIYSGLKQKKSK